MEIEKNRFDLEAEEFEKNFFTLKDKKIVLYGIGMLTMTLIERVKEFNIIGLLDRDEKLIGQYKYGIKILSRKEAEESADVVIINTVKSYWSIIYQRIQDWNIPIYTRDGKLASADLLEKKVDNDYWKNSIIDLKNKIDDYEIVSFDIFDTLIMRKVYDPKDVFVFVEMKLKKVYGNDFTYIGYRNQAVVSLKEPTLDDIFEKIKELTDWGEEKIEKIKDCEFNLDKYLMIARREMVNLCNEIVNKKEVYFISDMYYSQEVLYNILRQNGICVNDKKRIIVSCEYGLSKREGNLWTYYSKNIVRGVKALHIGDNVKADIENSKKNNIDSYMIMSASQMLQCSSMKEIVPKIKTWKESLFVGLVIEKLFNNPFALHATKGEVSFTDEKLAGYCLLGGVVYTFITWLLKNAEKDNVEQFIFLGRDGYFLRKAYNYICELLEIKKPDEIYLEVSRRALIVPMIETKEDIVTEINREKYIGTMKKFLYDRFGIEISQNIETDEEINSEKIMEYYSEIILNRAKLERKEYLDYLNTLHLEDKSVIVDSGHAGTIQYLLGKLLNKPTRGFYFSADLSDSNKYYKNNMKACFQKEDDKKGKEVNLYKNFRFVEAFFTAPSGMLLYIDNNGIKRYAPKMKNQKFFDLRVEMFQGILEFIKDMIEIRNNLEVNYYDNDAIFVDEIFGCMLDGGVKVTDKMREQFYYDETMQERKEVPLWQ